MEERKHRGEPDQTEGVKVEFEFHLTHEGRLDIHEMEALANQIQDIFRAQNQPSWVKVMIPRAYFETSRGGTGTAG